MIDFNTWVSLREAKSPVFIDKQVQSDLDNVIQLIALGWSKNLERACLRLSALIEHGRITPDMKQKMIVALRQAESLSTKGII